MAAPRNAAGTVFCFLNLNLAGTYGNRRAGHVDNIRIYVVTDLQITAEQMYGHLRVTVDGVEYQMTPVSMGNPHTVISVEDTTSFPVQRVGEQIECSPIFPEKVNVEFVRVIDRKNINMRVWERGS